ncbi:MAG: CubicO group peptidase beta-lactamase class family [Rhodoglobus sp.]|nr:CubicO group peptidase beta-lactamase class family [Rhodoglobus sp.]
MSGFAEPEFESLQDVFARVVGAQGRGGAALSIYRDARPVVDLVAGDYAQDGVQLLFSVSKAVTAIAAASAERDGALDLDAPLASFWPAFDRASTRAITTRMVLSHRSGIPALDRRLSLEEVLAGEDERALESQEPYFEPGTAHGYGAFTFGVFMNGVFRRTVGTDVGAFVAERLSAPLGLDLWIGTPEAVWPRVQGILYDPPALTPLRAAWIESSPIPAGTTSQLAATMDLFNSPSALAANWPSTSGVASARALARLLASTLGEVDGVRLIDDRGLDAMLQPRSEGVDRVLGIVTRFGTGMQLPFPQFPLLGPTSFGHEAAGGSAVFADRESGISVGYTTNVYPPMAGASAGFLALLPTIRYCLTH